MWWKHELLDRLILLDYSKRISLYSYERDSLEKEFLKKIENILEKENFILECFQKSNKLEKEWIDKFQNMKYNISFFKKSFLCYLYFYQINQQANIEPIMNQIPPISSSIFSLTLKYFIYITGFYSIYVILTHNK